MNELGVAIIGCGGITLQNHLPGLALCPGVKVIALCDANAEVLNRAKEKTGARVASPEYREVLKRDDIHAVIIATPNFLHADIAIAAAQAGKHVFCEKPLALNFDEARRMFQAAQSAGVRHMTAFTYRFVPAMRYMRHLVKSGFIGQPYHFRNCRLQDWGTRDVGWRQVAKLAGSGETGDMLSHRIDFAHSLFGPMQRLVAHTRRYHDLRNGHVSDLEDWVAVLSDFDNGATGVMESSKLATGRGESAQSQDYVEINGSEGTIVFYTERPRELQVTKKGEIGLRKIDLPKEFVVYPGSPRDPNAGDPLFVWRYDQNYEFISAIREQRPCTPSFYDGALTQGIIDAILLSEKEQRWVDVSGLAGQLK